MISDPISITGFILQVPLADRPLLQPCPQSRRTSLKMYSSPYQNCLRKSDDLEKITPRNPARLARGQGHGGFRGASEPREHARAHEQGLCGGVRAFAEVGRARWLKKEWEDAEEQRNASPTASAEFQGGQEVAHAAVDRSMSKPCGTRYAYVTYGSEDIKAAFDKLQGHRHDLYSLSSGLPFNFSERLRGLEDNLMVVWAPGVKTPKPMVRTSSSIHDLKVRAFAT